MIRSKMVEVTCKLYPDQSTASLLRSVVMRELVSYQWTKYSIEDRSQMRAIGFSESLNHTLHRCSCGDMHACNVCQAPCLRVDRSEFMAPET